MIILVVGDFGVGKDTFADILVNTLNDSFMGFVAKKVLSFTTRPPRFKGEDTHIFSTKQEYLENHSDIIAETKIGNDLYWTTKQQFGSFPFDVYVVDDIGVQCVLEAHIDKVFIIRITRPRELINLPKHRLNRKRIKEYKYEAHFEIENDGTIQQLEEIAYQIVLLLPYFKIYE